MGRPPALDDRQKAEIGRRLAAGESGRKLAKEFRVSESTIRANISAHSAKIRSVANKLATAEVELGELPISAQSAARSLADQLKGLSTSLVKTAAVNGKTAERLAAMAAEHVEGLALKPGMTVEEVMGLEVQLGLANGLLVTSNRATSLGTKLMAANEATPESGTVIVETGVPHD